MRKRYWRVEWCVLDVGESSFVRRKDIYYCVVCLVLDVLERWISSRSNRRNAV